RMSATNDGVTIHKTATYEGQQYALSNAGIADIDTFTLRFCKGSKDDPSIPRQRGLFTESLLEACRKYLADNNQGVMATRETSLAITKIEEALLWLGKRAEDRKRRGVQGTYKP